MGSQESEDLSFAASSQHCVGAGSCAENEAVAAGGENAVGNARVARKA